jgi:hypothetical protein
LVRWRGGSGDCHDREDRQHKRPQSGGDGWNPETSWRCDIH